MPRVSERRKNNDAAFDMAATLELNLDRYPTKQAMLTYMHNLLYAAEVSDLGVRQPDYLGALRLAVDFVEGSPGLIEGAATLQGYQAFMTGRETTLH